MNALKKRRILAGLTLKQAANRTGFSYQSMQKWEKGIVKPQADKLPVLAEAYGCEVNDFVEIYEETKKSL